MTRYRGTGGVPSKTPEPEMEPITIPVGGFKTVAAAEEAFMHLLKREGIDETWTWDATMRKIVLDPLFKALDTLAQKQAAFDKWQQRLIKEKQEQREARIAELRPRLRRLFAQSGVIKSYSTMKTADKAFAADKYWRRAKPDERRLLLDEYTAELRTHEAAARKQSKEHNIAALTKLIRNLDITVASRWHDAREIITRSDAFGADPQLAKMEPLDMLVVYDEYVRQLEKEYDEESRRLRAEHRRRARKARDAFKALLRELRDKGQLTRTSKWKATLPLIRSDERYTALLGLPGSTPLELWMDVVDDLQIAAEEGAARIEGALKEPVKLDTTFEAFDELCTTASVSSGAEARREAFDVIHERLARVAAEEARRAERKRRHRIEDLRDALRKVRSIEAETTYEAALPDMQDLPEFKILADEDRKVAFEKHTKRLREKVREREERERDRDGRRMDVDDDRDRERDRDRDRRRDLWDKERERDRDRDWRDRRDRDRDRDRERERERERDRDRDRDRERDRDRDHRRPDPRDRDRSRRDLSHDDARDSKRRRVSSPTSSRHEKEEGEI